MLPLLLLFLCSAASARDWMGLKRPIRVAAAAFRDDTAAATAPAPQAPAPRSKADTAWLSRTVRNIPVGSPGTFLGMLEGVRCFNCTPQAVHLNLSDSLTREAGFLSLRIEVWNAIERPVRDRRMYDFGNHCFFFGYKAVDTAWVGGELTEIRLLDVPCYPYLQRRLAAPVPQPVPVAGSQPASRSEPTASPEEPQPPSVPTMPAWAVDSLRSPATQALQTEE